MVGLLILTACGGGSGGNGGGADNSPGTEPSARELDCLDDANRDCDDDGYNNSADIDADGDGLIEIRTAAQLNAVRYALNGNGRKLSADAEFDDTGCGGANGITECSGYELVADISLAAYANNEGGKGWQPLGNDTNSADAGCQGAAFNGIFDGNGWTISELSINRSAEDCVGLFGHIAANSEIRNLTLRAESVVGRNIVGGLVGRVQSGRIVSSAVVAAEVSGRNSVGGLVGDGDSALRIYSSSVVAAEVRGGGSVGGLVGDTPSARIHSSSVVAGEVSGNSNFVGGLMGQGNVARVYSSSVVAAKVRGGGNVGGLVGNGGSSLSGVEFYSSSVVVGEVIGGGVVTGSLAGIFSGQLAYSYVVSGSNVNMLARRGLRAEVAASYWDSDTSDFEETDNHGDPKTTSELRSPTGYTDIYANWTKDIDIFGDGMINEPLAVWCDRDNSGDIGIGEKKPGNLIWDFGESNEYPAIRCTPLEPDEWRDWWFLNASGKPELDRDRLDEALNR